MTDILIQTISQWGTAGVFVMAGGYLLWDSWKKNKKIEEWFRDKMTAQESRGIVNNSLSDIKDQISSLALSHESFKNEIMDRVDAIEHKIDKHHPDHHQMEAARMAAVTSIAPSIHTIINEGLDNCEADHICVALLHNGSTSVAGIPYVKFGVIAEKYKPLRHPNDIDLVTKYKEEDIVSHNKLPSCIVHNKHIEFEICDDCPLVDIDPIIYNRCKNIGIKRIAFEAIRDIHNLTTGFVVVYKFDDTRIDMESLHSTTSTIEDLYRNMLATLSE